MSTDPLFTPIRMGNLHLPNRIVMAPLTRMRAGSLDHVPTQLQADYYAQRASAGLIVAAATAISPEGFGWADTPGLWSAEQVRGLLIANVNMDAERGNRLIKAGLADMVASGRPYIANPDLVERLATRAPLTEVDWETVYAAGPRGYSDYPTLRPAPGLRRAN